MGRHVLGDYVLAELEALRNMTAGQDGWQKFNKKLENVMEEALDTISKECNSSE